jgi:hypothetical protein
MDRKSSPTEQWDTAQLAGFGALLGSFGGMAVYVSHASKDGWFLPDRLLLYALTDAGLGALAGSLLFGAISAARNWLRRKPLGRGTHNDQGRDRA